MNTNLSKVPSINELAQRTRVSDEQLKSSRLLILQMVTIKQRMLKKRQHNAQRIDLNKIFVFCVILTLMDIHRSMPTTKKYKIF